MNESAIAVIGMSCRFPGAENITQFWQNLRDGVESVIFFSDEELIAAGIEPALLGNPNYVKANAILPDIDLFDAAFFGFSAGEAEMMDPQHRLFLEEAWKAIEYAGYNPETFRGLIGVYAGVGMNTYLLYNLYPYLATALDPAASYQGMIGNNHDYLTTRVSYKLNLKGPSVNVQTACSTSLVAVHVACQSLLYGECDMALAGGVGITVPQKTGYLYQEGMIASPDGHCRAFDAQAKGVVGGSGVGLVVLKRFAEAMADGDHIHAVIKGTAINNDGSGKVGYTAPSVDGQSAVIAEAQAIADVDADTITYIEAHGTGTVLGDPIEIRALTRAFRQSTQEKGFCAIGSVKTNFGHLDAAAGVAGLIKTVLALEHHKIPPSLHFTQPNPQIDFANSPFYVNAQLSEWQPAGFPRRAGVSSFGIGGTNAHVVVEEFTPGNSKLETRNSKSRSEQLLVLSAKTESAIGTATQNLADYLKQHPTVALADVAYTLHVGRQRFNYRQVAVCRDTDDAIKLLSDPKSKNVLTAFQEAQTRPVVFMFSGQGAQYVNMGWGLCQTEPTFREQIDRCAEFLKPLLDLDLRDVLYPDRIQRPASSIEPPASLINQTAITQPALFVIEYALATLWMAWGVRPQALIGHSSGEYAAACLAGVLSLEDALRLVAVRGKLMQARPPGTMLSVPLSEAELQPLLGPELSIAAINTPSLCVVSGPITAVEAFQNRLKAQGIEGLRLHTSHAFHSSMMDPLVTPFIAQVKNVPLHPPSIPWVSTVTGTWVTAESVTNPEYWGQNLRQTVRFADGVRQLLQDPTAILLEVGPGRTLITLTQQHPEKKTDQVMLPSLRHPKDPQGDAEFLLTTAGKLWLEGVQVDWAGFHAHEQRQRLPLPTYPFERQRYWIEPLQQPQISSLKFQVAKKPDIADWFYVPSWKRTVGSQARSETERRPWLVFIDETGLGAGLLDRLEQERQEVVAVQIGAEFTQLTDRLYTLNPKQPGDYDALFKTLQAQQKLPDTIVHLWSVTPPLFQPLDLERITTAQERGFYSLLFLAQAFGRLNRPDELRMIVISNNMQEVTGGDLLCPEQATLLGPVKVLPQEYPNIRCRSLDVSLAGSGWKAGETPAIQEEHLITQLWQECQADSADQVVAYRGDFRWVQIFEPARIEKPVETAPRLRQRGVYLITGGLGGIGLVLAEYLAKTVQARLILTGRSVFPAQDEWAQWLATQEQEDRISQQILTLQRLETEGAEVMVVCADVSDPEQMQAAITQAFERFGQINGVIHAAGIAGEQAFHAIKDINETKCEQLFQPKISGLLVLQQIFQEKGLDFCVLFSSLASILGGLGFVGYSAANLFMDAFVCQQKQVPFVSINWDAWKSRESKPLHPSIGGELEQLALTPEEGISVFYRILSRTDANQIVVSTGDLQKRIKKWINLESLEKQNVSEQRENSSARHLRPTMSTSYVAPRNELEQTLVNIWQQCLKLDQVGIHDDFFDLGGHSLLAMSLIGRIQKQFGKQIPLSALFEAPTIARLAQLLGAEPRAEAFSPLVRIQPLGDKPPLFCFHPGDGNVYGYAELANLLGTNQPVFGLQAFGLDAATAPLDWFEEMAQRYLESLNALEYQGPYLLAGHSSGGIIAYEMAQQLQRIGQQVALILLFDTWAPSIYPALGDEVQQFMEFAHSFGGFSNVNLFPFFCAQRGIDPGGMLAIESKYNLTGLQSQIDEIRKDLASLSAQERLQLLWQCAQQAGMLSAEHDTGYLVRAFQVYTANDRAIRSYAPQPYTGRIILFRAMDDWGRPAGEPTLGWEQSASAPIEVYDVPGDHYSLLRQPHVLTLAERLKMCLEQSRRSIAGLKA